MAEEIDTLTQGSSSSRKMRRGKYSLYAQCQSDLMRDDVQSTIMDIYNVEPVNIDDFLYDSISPAAKAARKKTFTSSSSGRRVDLPESNSVLLSNPILMDMIAAAGRLKQVYTEEDKIRVLELTAQADVLFRSVAKVPTAGYIFRKAAEHVMILLEGFPKWKGLTLKKIVRWEVSRRKKLNGKSLKIPGRKIEQEFVKMVWAGVVLTAIVPKLEGIAAHAHVAGGGGGGAAAPSSSSKRKFLFFLYVFNFIFSPYLKY